jgi:hypothetical protein
LIGRSSVVVVIWPGTYGSPGYGLKRRLTLDEGKARTDGDV